MSNTRRELADAISELRAKAALGDKDAIEKLAYLLGPESTLDVAETVASRSVDVMSAAVDDAFDAVDRVFDW